MKRGLMAFAAAGLLAVSMAGPVSADKGGVPNDNSCLGQATSAAVKDPAINGEAQRAQARGIQGPFSDSERGRSSDIEKFRAANCPDDPSAN